ncbi:MAG: anaerobic ribonucleoside-triphosphate reductase [Alphaproteobacteria bacterium]
MNEDEKKEITLTDEERQPCEIWSRVMGYHRPVEQWNIGKKAEFAERKAFKEPKEGSDDAR